MQRVAIRAEALGYDDLWASDHLVVPSEQGYPPPYLYDPLQSLAFAAAVTGSIGIGTSVLVLPQYRSPLALANSLASLDNLSGGRLVLGVGAGWSEREFKALDASFDHRGARVAEIIALFRVAWTDDPSTYEGRYYQFRDVRLLPKPGHEIPIWIGGASEGAIARAGEIANGYHGINVPLDEVPALVARLRARRADLGFTISLRVTFSARQSDTELETLLCGYSAAGIQHCLMAPQGGDESVWLECAERWAAVVDRAGVRS